MSVPIKVLIVDDSALMRDLLTRIQDLGDHPKAAIDDRVKSGHREKA
jgi:chemotaxis response regulator CheB